MFGWWKARKEYRARVEGEAKLLLKTMGTEAAWQHMFARVRKLSSNKLDNSFECHVLRSIEKQIGRKRGTDTATRMLDHSLRKK